MIIEKNDNKYRFSYKNSIYQYDNGNYYKEELSGLNYGNGNVWHMVAPTQNFIDYFKQSLIIYERELKLKRILKKNEKK